MTRLTVKKIILMTLILGFSCQDPFIRVNSQIDINDIFVPDSVTTQESINDPQQTGLACKLVSKTQSNTEILEVIEIPTDLPEKYDLSENMPPVRSQGNQASCVAWATTYYLKSYQEKIQNNYEYDTYNKIMSPAFVYNQTKSTINCGSGSEIKNALELLKEFGTTTWKEFPYSDKECSKKPSEDLLIAAFKNRIKEYFKVAIPDTNSNPNYTLINLMKTLIYQKEPLVIALDWENLVFETIDKDLIAVSYKTNPVNDCGHAVLIVGYDSEKEAFKIVNSWGTNWGNEGYGWLMFNFFKPKDDSDFQKGVLDLFVAFDEKDNLD